MLQLTGAVIALGLLIERLIPARRERADTQSNLMLWAVNLTLNVFVLNGVRMSLATWARAFDLPHLNLAAMPFVLGAAIYVCAADFLEYAFHRLEHAVPLFWRIHSLHHSDPCMNVSTANRHHWGAPLIKVLLVTPVAALLLRPTGAQVVCYNLVSLWGLVIHLNVDFHLGPLNRVLNSPNAHRIHHSVEPEHYDRNFGNILSVWDVLAGTYFEPQRAAAPATGLSGRPRRIGEALVWPLLKASRG
jgi:sterol desaturase/sphingolipid hydroxylase (fatty acid hydroxylase superfamily)